MNPFEKIVSEKLDVPAVFIVPSTAKRGDLELHEIAPQNIIFTVNFSLPSFGRFPLLCQTPLFPPPISIYVTVPEHSSKFQLLVLFTPLHPPRLLPVSEKWHDQWIAEFETNVFQQTFDCGSREHFG